MTSSRSAPNVHSKSDHSVENGLTPVDGENQIAEGQSSMERVRTVSVNSVTQTGNGSVVKVPVLHIPGETGELAGLSSEMNSQDYADGQQAAVLAPDKLKQVYAQIKAKKIKYKLIFATSVISMLTIAYASVLFPWFIPYYHTVVFPILYIIRVIVYTKSHWQLYCLDFCYFANLALLLFCWAAPGNEAFFGVVFGVVVGPVAIAILVFRNSIVFHDYDRMTSAYIHILPNLTVYLIKWYPNETSRFWYFYPGSVFHDTSINSNNSLTSYLPSSINNYWIWIVVLPLVWFLLHTVLYMLIENLCFTDKKYLTSYRWLSSNTKSVIYKALTFNGRITNQSKVKLSWVLFNIMYGIVSILIARLCYEYQPVHTSYFILLCIAAIYNGASFYIDVFAKRGLGTRNE